MNRFAIIPYDLYDDLANGEITLAMFQAMVLLHKWADWETGTVRKVRAGRLETACGDHGPAARTFQRAMKNLHDSGRIHSHHVPGSRAWYKIDINNYTALSGALKDTVLRPTPLKDWRALDTPTGAEQVGEAALEEYPEDGCEEATVLKSSQQSIQQSEQTSNPQSETISLSQSTLSCGQSESTREIAEIFGIADSAVEIQDPDKAVEFARWMMERFPFKKDGSPRISNMTDFLHHWNNNSEADNGFRPQFETFYKLTEREAAKSKEVPRSEWDWICRAPACNRPWTQELDGIKLCERCFIHFPHHPAEDEVKWVHQCVAYYPGTNGRCRCYQKATEQFADWWICPEHLEDVRNFYGNRRPYPEDADTIPPLIFSEPEETIPVVQMRELTTADEL